jgi:hypothetical protein
MKLKSLRLKKSEKSSEEVSVGYRPKPTLNKATFVIVFGVLLASASFYEGTVFQRNTDVNTTGRTGTSNSGNPERNDSNSQTDSYVRNHVIGEVTADSSTSVTIQEASGQNGTFKITSSTQIEANGQSIKATEIENGDVVVITKASNSSSTASKIVITQGTFGTTSSSNTSGGSSTNSGSSTTGQSNTSNTPQSSTTAPQQLFEAN